MSVGACALRRPATGRDGRELDHFPPAALVPARATVFPHTAAVARRARQPLVERATPSLSPDSAHSRSVLGSGGLSSRRSVLAAVVGDRSLSSLTLRPKLPGQCAREIADRLPSVLRLVALHASSVACRSCQCPGCRNREKFGECVA